MRILQRVSVLLVLVLLAGFATLAKNAQYLPVNDPAHYLTVSGKLKTNSDHTPVVAEMQPLFVQRQLVSPEPDHQFRPVEEWDRLPVDRINLSSCIRHRAPPTTSALPS